MRHSTDPAAHEVLIEQCESQPMLEHKLSSDIEESSRTWTIKIPTGISRMFTFSPFHSDGLESIQISAISERSCNRLENTGEKTLLRSRYFQFLSRAILYSFAIWGCLNLINRGLQAIQTPGHISCNCGNSTAEALSLGCKYDLLAGGWLREACIDEELSQEFDRAGPGPDGEWGYYADLKGTIPLNVTQIGAYADDPHARYWTTFDWHLAHCIFVWRKQFRSPITGRKVEARHDTESHILHCGKMFLKKKPAGVGIVTHNGAALNTDLSEREEAEYRGLSLAKIRPGLEALQKAQEE